jgi:uncharacterized protein (TIGR03435 family)
VRRILVLPVAGLSALVAGTWAPVRAQSDAKPLSFDVASVKPTAPDTPPGTSTFTVASGGRLLVTAWSLREIVRTAYQLPLYAQIISSEAILDSSFDIIAKSDGMPVYRFPPGLNTPTHPVYPMLRTLLAERFKLATHLEKKTLPMYALVMNRPGGDLGPRLHRSTADCAPINAARGSGAPSASAPRAPGDPLPCGIVGSVGPPMRVVGDSQSMANLIYVLSGYAGRNVIDRTGLSGLFSFTLEFTFDAPSQVSSADSNAPSFFTAIREQLGLKLDSTTGPVDVLVIDHVERPTEN